MSYEAPADMRPYAYYTVMRQSRDPKTLRLRMALYAKEHGVKPAARAFKSTPKTVRKWVRRFDGKLASLEAHSRAPSKRPRKLGRAAEEKILAAKRACPRASRPAGSSGSSSCPTPSRRSPASAASTG